MTIQQLLVKDGDWATIAGPKVSTPVKSERTKRREVAELAANLSTAHGMSFSEAMSALSSAALTSSDNMSGLAEAFKQTKRRWGRRL